MSNARAHDVHHSNMNYGEEEKKRHRDIHRLGILRQQSLHRLEHSFLQFLTLL